MYTTHYQGMAQVVVIAGLALLYFLPALVAWINRRKNAAAITLLNLFLGWTFVGWVLPLVLACIPDGHVLQAPLPRRNHWHSLPCRSMRAGRPSGPPRRWPRRKTCLLSGAV